MNKFKKKSKTKGLALGIAILSSAAVVSTGFAAWVIGGGDTETATGSINADTVENGEHTITKPNFSPNKVYFGAPTAPGDTTYHWLSNNSIADNKENLELTADFTVSNVTTTLTNDTTSLEKLFDKTATKFEEDLGKDDEKAYSVAAGNKVVAAMPEVVFGAVVDGQGVYISFNGMDTDKTTAKFTVTVKFKWGSKFDGENPYTFYNNKEKTDELKAQASEYLGYVANIDTSFTLTIVTL